MLQSALAMESVSGKTVLVTGAASGMGRLYAGYAAAEGAARVILWDVDAAGLEKARAELGGPAVSRLVDLSRAEEVRDAAAAAGAVDVLVNNAGIVVGAPFWEHDDAQIEKTMAVNALAPMRAARALLPAMMASGRDARILNVASAAGLIANPRMSVYCASKWAVVGWSESLRLELELTGSRVKVTTFCPAYVGTGMFGGAKAPLLTPILAPEAAASAAWAAMKAGEPMLMMPWTVRLSAFMRGVLPLRVFDALAGGVFGVYDTMSGFTGRAP